MIAFADTVPTSEPLHGNFILTFNSGGEAVKIMLTRHALVMLGRNAMNSGREAFEGDAKIVSFHSRAGQ